MHPSLQVRQGSWWPIVGAPPPTCQVTLRPRERQCHKVSHSCLKLSLELETFATFSYSGASHWAHFKLNKNPNLPGLSRLPSWPLPGLPNSVKAAIGLNASKSSNPGHFTSGSPLPLFRHNTWVFSMASLGAFSPEKSCLSSLLLPFRLSLRLLWFSSL